MKEYEFTVGLDCRYCDGTIKVEANDMDEAYENAKNKITDALQSFPLGISYHVECINEPDDEGLVDILNYIKRNIEIMSDEWALATIPFCKLDESVVEKLDIKQVLSEDGTNLSTEEIMDEDNEIGLHIYWDKKNHPDSVEIGLYAFGGGDIKLSKSLKDIVTEDEYKAIFDYGHSQIK